VVDWDAHADSLDITRVNGKPQHTQFVAEGRAPLQRVQRLGLLERGEKGAGVKASQVETHFLKFSFFIQGRGSDGPVLDFLM
jgi:hypothetical protein